MRGTETLAFPSSLDDWIDPAKVERFRADLREGGVNSEVHVSSSLFFKDEILERLAIEDRKRRRRGWLRLVGLRRRVWRAWSALRRDGNMVNVPW